jgi:hypothetical protein
MPAIRPRVRAGSPTRRDASLLCRSPTLASSRPPGSVPSAPRCLGSASVAMTPWARRRATPSGGQQLPDGLSSQRNSRPRRGQVGALSDEHVDHVIMASCLQVAGAFDDRNRVCGHANGADQDRSNSSEATGWPASPACGRQSIATTGARTAEPERNDRDAFQARPMAFSATGLAWRRPMGTSATAGRSVTFSTSRATAASRGDCGMPAAAATRVPVSTRMSTSAPSAQLRRTAGDSA